MSNYRRRRFLTDLLFVGGALLAAAGLASTGEANPGDTPTPLASQTPAGSPTCEIPMPGQMVAPPPATPSPQPVRKPISRDPFNGPAEHPERAMPGKMALPQKKQHAPAGGLPAPDKRRPAGGGP